LLARPKFEPEAGIKNELLQLMRSEARKWGLEKLPIE
jgi:hypothetical protein